jgi:RecA/RadA recombinase
MAKKTGISEAASQAIRGSFDLNKFKKSKMLSNSSVKFKEQKWIPLSKAFQDVTSIPGIPVGHITLLRGHSDTGKTTALLEAAVAAQRMGILPVLIITEMKWSWEHAREMGLQFEEVVDTDTGEILDYEGFFLYTDRGRINTIEDVSEFILDLIDEQKKGNLPHNLLFLWDSIGSVPCELSVRSNKNNNEWNAGAMSTQFGNNVNQKILLSRKEGTPYTNTLVAINKVWTMKPGMPMEQPKLQNKGGMAMWYDATLVITFGNITNSGTSKIKATKGGKQVEFAKRTKIQVDKNHINGITTRGAIVMTTHGFLEDDKKAIDVYKKEHSDYWLNTLGSTEFDLVEEGSMEEDVRDIAVEFEINDL